MPFCNKRKIFWYTPARTASRSIGTILEFLNFKYPFSHDFWGMADKLDYFSIWTVRNPYNRIVSLYNWEFENNNKFNVSFLDWVKAQFENPISTSDKLSNYIHVYKNKNLPKRVVKYENLKEDLFKLDLIKTNLNEGLLSVIKNQIDNNNYKNILGRTNWKELYNEKIADFVLKTLDYEFEMFNYNINSWKDGTP